MISKRGFFIAGWMVLLLFSAGWKPAVSQPLRLAAVFGDGMVIQQGINAPVWGWASPNSMIKVELAGFTAHAKTGQSGKWMVRLPALDYGGPYELTVTGEKIIRLKNIMVGEVWLASGQSNMEWSVGMGIGPGTEQEIASADFPDIRYFTVPHKTSVVPLEDMEPSSWKSISPETVKNLSAVAWFFARELHLHRKVAVGIISSSWGATSAHAWISSEILATHPDFTEIVRKQDKDPDRWDETVKTSLKNDRVRDSLAQACQTGIQKGVFLPGFDDRNWKTADYPVDMEKAGLRWFWGVSWFRKSFTLPDHLKGKKATLTLYLRARETTLYLNGKEITKKVNPEGEVMVSIPAGLLQKGKNVLAVRMYQIWGTGLVGSRDTKPLLTSNDRKFNLLLDGQWQCSNNFEPSIPGNQGYYNQYSVQFNGRIAPVIPYGIRGVIWYQGEGNASRAFQYRTLFPMVIQDWRTRWGQGYFPFVYVQLANHREKKAEPSDDEVAELREAQAMTLIHPNTGMACAIDIGDPLDIHPRNKRDVGKRLYLVARHVAYGENLVYSGPVYDNMQVEGNRIRVIFTSTGSGLVTRNGEKLKGFAICGNDRKFVWADAVIDGNSVRVSSPEIAQPVAVRYSWETNPEGNLTNREGLPAVPFRTDNFKGITE